MPPLNRDEQIERAVELFRSGISIGLVATQMDLSVLETIVLLKIGLPLYKERLARAEARIKALAKARAKAEKKAEAERRGHYSEGLLCGCGRDYMTVPLGEAHSCPAPRRRWQTYSDRIEP